MSKLAALFQLFRKGSEVSNVEAWKARQITANMLVALLAAMVAVARAFGVALPIGDDDLAAIGGGLFAIYNIALTAATSKRAGLPGLAPVQADAGPDDAAANVPGTADLGGPVGSSGEG